MIILKTISSFESELFCLSASFNLYTVYVGRFLTGFASAGYIPSVLIYVAEISQPQHRGVLSAITLPAIAMGSLLAYCLGSLIPWNFVAIGKFEQLAIR